MLPIDEKTYLYFASHTESFNGKAKMAAFSPATILEIAPNKFQLATFCKATQIPAPKTTYLKDYQKGNNQSQLEISLPLIVKPEPGWGDRNVYHIAGEEAFSNIQPTTSL